MIQRVSRWTARLVCLGAACLAAAPAAAQRRLPDPATPSFSSAGGAPRVSFQSRDFEWISELVVSRTGRDVVARAVVRLAGNDPRQYAQGLGLKLWADTDGDGQFGSGELVIDDTRFLSQSVDGTLTYSGTLTLDSGQTFTDGTLVRCVLCYGDEPQPVGEFVFGDVVDRQHPVDVVQPTSVPVVLPGSNVPAAPFSIVENLPGRLKGTIALVSPKGTAISLTRTSVRVTRGDVRLGQPTLHGPALHIPVEGASTQPSTIEVQPVMEIEPGSEGFLTLKTSLFGQEVTVAVVAGAPRIERVGDVASVRPGGEAAVAPLAIAENARGQLKGTLALVSPKGTAISLTRTRVGVRSGNVVLGEARVEGGRTLLIPVQSASTEPSRIEVELVLTIDRDAPAWIEIASELARHGIRVARVERGGRD